MILFFLCSCVSGVHIALFSFHSATPTGSARIRTTSPASPPPLRLSFRPRFSVPSANISRNTDALPLSHSLHLPSTFHNSTFPHFIGRFTAHSHQYDRDPRGNRLGARGKRREVGDVERPDYLSGFPVSPLSKSRGNSSLSVKQRVRLRSPRGSRAMATRAGSTRVRVRIRCASAAKSGPSPRHQAMRRSFWAGRFHSTIPRGSAKYPSWRTARTASAGSTQSSASHKAKNSARVSEVDEVNGLMDGFIDGFIDSCIDGFIDSCIDGFIDGFMDSCIEFDSFNAFMDEFIDGFDSFNAFDSFIKFDSFTDTFVSFINFDSLKGSSLSTFSALSPASSNFQGAIPRGSGANRRAKSAGSSDPSPSESNSSAV